jgi:hypothetical protein
MVFSGQLQNSHRAGFYCQRSPERIAGREFAIQFFKNTAEAV